MFQQLTIRFDSREEFMREFESNISRGGLFIPTVDDFQMREVVDLDLELTYCGQTFSTQAEVVSQLGAELNPAGGVAGVAVQFLESTEELRARLVEVTGMQAQDLDSSREDPGQRRRHRRGEARVATEVLSAGHSITAQARDISESGALIAAHGAPIPVGDSVELKIVHPRTGEHVVVTGSVVRHVERAGGATDIAVEFEEPDDPEAASRLDDLRAAAHAHRLGGITGSIAALGIPNLLQMFPNSANEGTLVLTTAEGVEGRLLFQSGNLRHAEIGGITGAKAVARMLEWKDGDFEFHPSIVPGEPDGPCVPMDSVMLQALHRMDELATLDTAALPREARLATAGDPADLAEMEKLEGEVLDWATLGATVGELLDALPQFDAEIYEALIALIKRGAVQVSS
ncbi:MAG: PilZ domain-containing protein [Deltaproteobacteria bacterium]|nr:PilZ domain-containing protein [Deltaproteobacteria bacterium]MBW2414119.1 PilZ domain-containing protein [Deltaproteobacteria bacterium]